MFCRRVIVTWGVLSQGDYIWLEPETSGEFDVAVGAQVRSISGGSIHVVDDDKKVSQDGVIFKYVGSGGRAVERRTVNRGDGGSIPPTAVSKLRQFRSPHICLCLSEETLIAGGPFYLVSRVCQGKY